MATVVVRLYFLINDLKIVTTLFSVCYGPWTGINCDLSTFKLICSSKILIKSISGR